MERDATHVFFLASDQFFLLGALSLQLYISLSGRTRPSRLEQVLGAGVGGDEGFCGPTAGAFLYSERAVVLRVTDKTV